MHHPQPRSLLRDAVARRTAAAGALVAAALLPAADLAAQSFYSELVFPTTDAPRAVALGDLNGDGHPDAVTLDTKLFGWTASVSLNSGSGGLLAPTALPIPGVASDVAIGDVTGDGRADLVVGMGFPTGFAVFAGTATGGLSTPHVWVIPNGTTFSLNVDALALGDVNEDGMLDVVTCNRTGGMALQHTSVFLANGTGSFAAPFDATPGVFVRQCLVLGDFNGDRHLDIDISSGPNLLVPGNGRGGFLPAQDTGLGLALDLAAADLDADGHLDLLRVSAGNPGSVGVAPGTGTGAFGAPTAYATGQFPQALVAADIDGDGAIDVATANMGSSAGAVAILRGNGAGALGAPLLIPTGGSGSQTSDLAVADMDGDGRPDIVACNDHAETLSLLLQSDGTFALGAPTHASGSPSLFSVALADLDADGDIDAVASRGSGSSTTVSRWLGNGLGALGALVESTAYGPQEDIAIGDLDGDGRPDAVASSRLLDAAVVLVNGGRGAFLPASTFPAGDAPAAIALGDVDRDGRLDAVIANEQSHDVSVLFGDGAGALGAPAHHFVGGLQPNAVALGDLDGNGALDIVSANRATHDVSVLLGDGRGGFAVQPVLPEGHALEAVAIGDLDGDGDADLVTASDIGGAGNTLSVFLGDGRGDFAAPLAWPVEHGSSDLALGDLDGDGVLDLVTVQDSVSTVTVRLGQGDGSLSPPTILSVGSATGVALADMNGDQRLDIVVAQASGSGAQSLTVLPNVSQPHTWHDLGSGLAGSAGTPVLAGTGSLQAGSPGALTLSQAGPGRLAVLFVSPTSLPAAFKGGTLIPVPPLLVLPLLTGASGVLQLAWSGWLPGPPGSSWHFQFGIADAAGPQGAALSNALRAVQP